VLLWVVWGATRNSFLVKDSNSEAIHLGLIGEVNTYDDFFENISGST